MSKVIACADRSKRAASVWPADWVAFRVVLSHAQTLVSTGRPVADNRIDGPQACTANAPRGSNMITHSVPSNMHFDHCVGSFIHGRSSTHSRPILATLFLIYGQLQYLRRNSRFAVNHATPSSAPQSTETALMHAPFPTVLGVHDLNSDRRLGLRMSEYSEAQNSVGNSVSRWAPTGIVASFEAHTPRSM